VWAGALACAAGALELGGFVFFSWDQAKAGIISRSTNKYFCTALAGTV
jgi:hypothetical protein